MTKRQLREVWFLTKEVEMWNEKLEELRSRSMLSSPSLSNEGAGGSGGPSDKVGDLAVRIVDMEEMINKFVQELERAKKDTTEWIFSIDDSFVRQMMMHRYIDLMTWEDTSKAIGYSNAGALRQYHKRWLRDNNIQ